MDSHKNIRMVAKRGGCTQPETCSVLCVNDSVTFAFNFLINTEGPLSSINQSNTFSMDKTSFEGQSLIELYYWNIFCLILIFVKIELQLSEHVMTKSQTFIIQT